MSQPAVLQHLYTLFYGGDTGVKLVVARKLFLRYGWELERNSRLTRGLSELVRLHEGLKLQMLAMELDRICSRCAQKTDGGCCSQAMAAEIDVAQLLLNMLAGVPVSRLLPGAGLGDLLLVASSEINTAEDRAAFLAALEKGIKP